MDKCVCDGNWRHLVAKCEPLFDKVFQEIGTGVQYRFFGLVWAEDDFYYGMTSLTTGKPLLLSCVGNFESYGLELVQNHETE